MKTYHPNTFQKAAQRLLSLLLLSAFTSFQFIAAQSQLSAFTVPGWVPGTAPIFTGNSSNTIHLSYGDSLFTALNFSGEPNDGLGTDLDNIASMSFSYSYTVYLTTVGDSFSLASIPMGTHTISAYQSCSSGAVPPWTIGYDNQPTFDTNNINMSIGDMVSSCIPAGNYQIDIVFNNYAVNSVGPNPLPIQLTWQGYSYSASSAALATVNAPSSGNTEQVTISPVTNYMLRQVGFVQINASSSCPPLSLSLSASIQTTEQTTATVAVSYKGQCQQNPCTFLWSNGQTTATATNLTGGNYTVTVTSPCGATATATININTSHSSSGSAETLLAANTRYSEPDYNLNVAAAAQLEMKKHEKPANSNQHKSVLAQVQLTAYPNPAKDKVTFNLAGNNTTINTVKVYDMLGNEIPVAITVNDSKLAIDLSNLNAGVYVYELEGESIYKGKFVKE